MLTECLSFVFTKLFTVYGVQLVSMKNILLLKWDGVQLCLRINIANMCLPTILYWITCFFYSFRRRICNVCNGNWRDHWSKGSIAAVKRMQKFFARRLLIWENHVNRWRLSCRLVSKSHHRCIWGDFRVHTPMNPLTLKQPNNAEEYTQIPQNPEI